MKLCDGEIMCPGCKFKTKLKGMRAPRHFEPTILTFKCATCESTVLAKLMVVKGKRL